MVGGVLIRDASERLVGARTYRRKLDLLCPLGAPTSDEFPDIIVLYLLHQFRSQASD
jgi:hypothetical protein